MYEFMIKAFVDHFNTHQTWKRKLKIALQTKRSKGKEKKKFQQYFGVFLQMKFGSSLFFCLDGCRYMLCYAMEFKEIDGN